MASLSIQPTFPIFTESDGLPLEFGYIWIGTANLDPQGNPIAVYWDAALTIAAAQPIRTLNGYPSRNGTPARMYVNSDYSIRVQNSKGSLVYSAPAATERYGNIITGLNAADIAFDPAGENAVQRTVEDKLREFVSLDDYETQADAIQQIIASNAFYLNNLNSFELTVGTTGDFSSINNAIDAAVRMRPNWQEGNSYCTIRLLSGFVMREQVLIAGGTDLGWIKIVADDANTVIDETYITAYLDQLDDLVPAFGARENSVLPTIGCQFSYNNSATAKDGVGVILGSKIGFMPETGVIRARNGLKILYDSQAYCYMEGLTIGGAGSGAGTITGVDFSYAANRGCHIAYGSRGLLARSNFSYSGGDFGVYCIWGSYGDLYQSNASHSAGTAFIARDGSFLNCRECNASYSVRGFHALHNGRINARSVNPANIWVGDGAQHCTEYGVLASYASQIDAIDLNCDYNTGSAAVSASFSSNINFSNGSAKYSTVRGIWATDASSISAESANVSNGSANGFYAESGATISCQSGFATDCMTYGIIADSGSNISAENVDASRCVRGVQALENSKVNFNSGIANNCTDRGVSALNGSTVNCQSAILQNATNYGITARDASVVSASNADCSGAGVNGVYVLAGGIVSFGSGTGTINISINTLTANGIVFQ